MLDLQAQSEEPTKNRLGMPICAYNPNAWETKTGGSCGLLINQSSLLYEFQGGERSWLLEKKVMGLEDHRGYYLASM